MKLLFASDLDQTLIYSRNSMGENITEIDLVEVERINGKPQSYMTKKSQKALWELGTSAFFLPVTTRTQEQYERVTGIFENPVAPRFAVISNGAVILEDGEPVKEWSEEIREQCVSRKTVIEELLPLIERYFSEEWVLNIKQADGWFVYLIIDRTQFPEEKLEFYARLFREIGWAMSLQGRKLYFMPESITKARAMEYVKQRLNADYVMAAGDSLLDLDLLESADKGFLAVHGEAVKSKAAFSAHIQITERSGIEAGEEILAHVAETALQHRLSRRSTHGSTASGSRENVGSGKNRGMAE
ncbi:HAD hydrolase family protein [Planococcus sp. N028]|uniref:HAD hydrolase family protein n=1 Tax=Planococcus shixiaomingii TaxID=3058393 RepID=A0ABT8N280_9BACL|nr:MULTISPECIES: HAD hydrolase family protein [unclassified Planococcus (in: firmicutes)]MDN7241991.1 HAD hydrolase family protein [Planococcus sp. N028]WKA54272.1 HAD hydrolase family protein [Planococcus sp. N022]